MFNSIDLLVLAVSLASIVGSAVTMVVLLVYRKRQQQRHAGAVANARNLVDSSQLSLNKARLRRWRSGGVLAMSDEDFDNIMRADVSDLDELARMVNAIERLIEEDALKPGMQLVVHRVEEEEPQEQRVSESTDARQRPARGHLQLVATFS